MCGIFGVVSRTVVARSNLDVLVRHSQQRGRTQRFGDLR